MYLLLLIYNEILCYIVGLDPGIDHLLVMKAVDNIHKRGGVVKELISLCGGLPDPVSADNPFRYKLSWSTKGMLSATGNSARYLLKGELIEVPGNDLLLHGRASSRFPTLRLEALPNRDSLGYKELYGVPNVHSICRGTLRYEGTYLHSTFLDSIIFGTIGRLVECNARTKSYGVIGRHCNQF